MRLILMEEKIYQANLELVDAGVRHMGLNCVEAAAHVKAALIRAEIMPEKKPKTVKQEQPEVVKHIADPE